MRVMLRILIIRFPQVQQSYFLLYAELLRKVSIYDTLHASYIREITDSLFYFEPFGNNPRCNRRINLTSSEI